MTDARHVVLIVDDEESMRFFLRKTLRRDGYEVIEAADGPDAIEAAHRTPPDIALLDIRMPGMDGVALMRALRTVQPRLPVVLMTAYGSVENALQAMKQGADDYVTKPFRVDAIRTTVARALKKHGHDPRPPTLRTVETAPAAAAAPQEVPAPTPQGNVEVPERGLAAYLRERVAARELPVPPGTAAGDLPLKEAVKLAEIVYLDELLSRTRGNVSRAAQIAGITRPNLHRKVGDLGLHADDYRRAARREKGDDV